MIKNILVVLTIIIGVTVSAQRPEGGRPGGANAGGEKSGLISGQIIDSISNKPIVFATVKAYNQKDSTLSGGAVTNDVGEFFIKNLKPGKLYLSISYLGYDTKYISNIELTPLNMEKDFNKILLFPDGMLDGVDVIGDRAAVRYEIDKKIVSVENMNTVASATAAEVLENIPSVTVDIDGNVKLRGSSGFTLLIDGAPSNMEASDALQMIPASSIKDIEIITNPSAKYDAEGTSGIINIIMKKDKLQGVSTLINLNGGNYVNYGGDFLTSINREKIKFNVGGNYKQANRYRDIFQERRTTSDTDESAVIGEGRHRFFRTNYELNTAIEYTPNRKNKFSIGLNGNQRQYNAAANYFFNEYLNDSLTASYENREQTLRQFYGFSATPSYTHLIKGDKEHFFTVQGMFNYYDGTEKAGTEFFNSNNEIQGGNAATEIGPSRTLRVNFDYELPLKNEKKFKAGLRTDFGNNSDNQDSEQYDLAEQEYVPLPLFSSDVTYLQNVYSGYSIFSGKLKKKLGYQLGLRAEYTDRLINIATGNQETKIQRLDWFPSAHFSYSKDDKNQFKANFARRIQRPRSWHLEPFITWEDPYTVRTGNPNLLPEYIQSYEVGYIRNLTKGSFSTEVYYRRTNNMRQRIQEVYSPNVIIKRPINAGASEALGTEIAYSKRWTKWWSMDAGTNLYWFKIDGEVSGESLYQESFTYNARIANNFTILKDYKVQFVGKYSSREIEVQGFNSAVYSFDIAIKKDFLDRKLSATFQMRNLFNTEVRETTVETASLYSYRLATPKWPVFSVSLSLRLNNFKNQDKIETGKAGEF